MGPDKILPESRLEEDLGMTGLDAADFLERFARAFDVDLTGLDFHRHFGPECFLVPGWLRAELDAKGYGMYPVTVAHLLEVAKAKRWTCPLKDTAKKPSNPAQLAMWDRELDG